MGPKMQRKTESAKRTFFFYDDETSGVHHNFDQVYQFAGVRTDENLNIIPKTEVNLLCRPRPDVIPHPKAFLTHRIDIRQLEANGMSEFELAGAVQSLLLQEGTTISGYNTMAFDDMMTRNMMYRNMRSPYDHEWKGENNRFDIMKLVTMMYALRPETLNWKINADGVESFKLSDLSEANGIVHENAHDALSDVYATISVARLIKERNPRAFDYLLNMAKKENAMALLSKREPLLHVSGFYGKGVKCTSLVLPLIMDAENKNKILCVDLRHDPTDVLSMSSNEIRKYLFTSREELHEGAPKVPLLGIESNKLPIIIDPTKMLNHKAASRCDLDVDQCHRNAEIIRNNRDFVLRVQQAFIGKMPVHHNPYAQIYTGGFLSSGDNSVRTSLTLKTPETGLKDFKIENADIFEFACKTNDTLRQFDLMLRAKWNSFSDKILSSSSFSALELKTWSDYIQDRLYNEDGNSGLTIDGYRRALEMVKIQEILSEEDCELLDHVTNYIDDMEKKAKMIANLASSKEMMEVAQIESECSPSFAKFIKIKTDKEEEAKREKEEEEENKKGNRKEQESSLSI